MIPALFGLASEERYTLWRRAGNEGQPPESASAIPREERLNRVINLLEIAAENAALDKYREEYELRFRDALFPSWAGEELALNADLLS